MGQIRDARIAAWQEKAGIEPARGDSAELLQRMSDMAFELIKVIELERSGIRNGDGWWSGCDGMGETARDMAALCNEWLSSKYDHVTEEVRINSLTLAETLATPGGQVNSLQVHKEFARARGKAKWEADDECPF